MLNDISNPVFIIGVPRSGTTILYEAFARHEQLGWPSNYTRKFPSIPQLGLLLRLTNNSLFSLSGQKKQYNRVIIANKLLPRPAEAYEFWNYITGIDFARQYLINHSVSEESRNRITSAIKSILFWEGKSMFSAKLTGPSRIYFLKSIFPNARFIHVVRDGRAVVHSMLNSTAWSSTNFLKQPWWSGGLTEEDLDLWKKNNNEPSVLAAIQWNRIIGIAHNESLQYSSDSYIEIKYEEFVADPELTIKNIYNWCKLPASDNALEYLHKIKLLPEMNEKYKNDMTAEVVEHLTQIMLPQLRRLGYI